MTQPLKYILESLLFVSDEPLSVPQLKAVLESEETGPIREALDELRTEYDQRRGGFELREVAGGYQLRTRPDYSEWVKRLLKPSPTRLSRASLETLAIIAYKQPIIRADIEHIRGVDCGGVLRMLLEKKLIRVLGRKDIPGRPMIYGTTRQFLEVFNLKDLRDLPSPKEIEALGLENEELYSLGDDEEGGETASAPESASTAEGEPEAPNTPPGEAAAAPPAPAPEEDAGPGEPVEAPAEPTPEADPPPAEGPREDPSGDGKKS
jgi:segregation and condensation protein B